MSPAQVAQLLQAVEGLRDAVSALGNDPINAEHAPQTAMPLTLDDVAATLGIAAITVGRLARRAYDPMPCSRFGRAVRFCAADVEEWRRRQNVAPISRKRKPKVDLRSGGPEELSGALLKGARLRAG